MIQLEPLADDRVDELVVSLLEGGEIPGELLGRVVETAGGNPFFLSELIRSLVGSGTLVRDGTTWVATDGASVELPTTIEKVILARLDALPARPRDVLTAASVLGRAVDLPLLQRLVGSDPRAETDELVRAGLFERDGQPDEVWFSHALIQEVAYGSLLKRRRRELHATAAAAIEELWPERIDEYLGLLAHHHRGAGDLEAARRWHDLAAERAERLHAGDEALDAPHRVDRARGRAREDGGRPRRRRTAPRACADPREDGRRRRARGTIWRGCSPSRRWRPRSRCARTTTWASCSPGRPTTGWRSRTWRRRSRPRRRSGTPRAR